MRIAILGASGTLGTELAKQLSKYNPVCLDREDLDLLDFNNLQTKLLEINPEVIFNCAAYNAVDKAETDRELAYKLNADLPMVLAKLCKENNSTLVHYSSGFIFDGEKEAYTETDIPNAISVYGQTKHEGEQAIQKNCENYYIIRLNLLFGSPGKSKYSKKTFPDLVISMVTKNSWSNFLAKVFRMRKTYGFIYDEVSTPTYSVDLAAASIALFEQKYPYGIYHLVNEGRASWYDFAKEIFTILRLRVKINAISAMEMQKQAPRLALRPKSSVLLNNKFPKIRSWQLALKEYLLNSSTK